jgi:phosphoadenosine phosphosulfate reductase
MGGGKYVLNPILYWTERDVWEFIQGEDIPYCSLYDEGFKRLGCIGCPMASAKERRLELNRWPGFEKLYRRSFARMWERKAGTINRNNSEWFGSRKFNSSDELFDWWISNEPSPEDLNKEQVCMMGFH